MNGKYYLSFVTGLRPKIDYDLNFRNSLIIKGRKIYALNLFDNLFLNLKFYYKNRDPRETLVDIYEKIKPCISLAPVKLGAFVYKNPAPINEKREMVCTIKWILKPVRNKKKDLNLKSLLNVLHLSLEGKGPAFEKKMSTYRLANDNSHLMRFLRL